MELNVPELSAESAHPQQLEAASMYGVPFHIWHSLTDEERSQVKFSKRRGEAFKTALCHSYKETGSCLYGDHCRFAHGENELRLAAQSHPKYKTQLCNKFSVSGSCPYGSRCQFIHRRLVTTPRLQDGDASAASASTTDVRRTLNPPIGSEVQLPSSESSTTSTGDSGSSIRSSLKDLTLSAIPVSGRGDMRSGVTIPRFTRRGRLSNVMEEGDGVNCGPSSPPLFHGSSFNISRNSAFSQSASGSNPFLGSHNNDFLWVKRNLERLANSPGYDYKINDSYSLCGSADFARSCTPDFFGSQPPF